MHRFFAMFVALLAINGCLPGTDLFFDGQHHFSTNNGHAKEHLLPSHYVECNDRFYWNMTDFTRYDYLTSPMSFQNADYLSLSSVEPIRSLVSGFQSSSGFVLTDTQKELCEAIYREITGVSRATYVTQTFYQLFSHPLAKALAQRDFTPITAATALLRNEEFELKDKAKIPVFNRIIPFSVSCKEPWRLKKDVLSPTGIIFQGPEGLCAISLHDYALTLSSGKTLRIAVRGQYDRADRDRGLMITIERFGFIEPET